MSIICKQLNGEIWAVTPEGRLDQSQNLQLENSLNELLDKKHCYLIIDLSETTYINSGGLRCLVSAWRKARQCKGDVILCSLSGRVSEVFSLVGFDEVFPIYPSIDEAQQHSFM